jgi:2-C-methyl-D-erythritol 4-phosphate cytidylyltransferase
MVEWSIAAMRAAAGVRAIVVARPPGHDPLSARDAAWEGVLTVAGGATRARSVANALAAVETELVAIHDAARPLVTPALVEAVLAALRADPEAAGAIAAAPVTDTIKRAAGPGASAADTRAGRAGTLSALGPDEVPNVDSVESGGWVVRETVDRRELWAAQTPQAFRTEALRRALAAHDEGAGGRDATAAGGAATDEAMLVEAAGGRVLIHPAPAENLKVTTPLDLRLAEMLLADRDG